MASEAKSHPGQCPLPQEPLARRLGQGSVETSCSRCLWSAACQGLSVGLRGGQAEVRGRGSQAGLGQPAPAREARVPPWHSVLLSAVSAWRMVMAEGHGCQLAKSVSPSFLKRLFREELFLMEINM